MFSSNKKVQKLAEEGHKLSTIQQFDKSIKLFKKALKIEPTNPNLLAKIGLVYGTSGNLPKADIFLTKALDFDPNHMEALHTLMFLAGVTGNAAKGVEYLKRLASQGPKFIKFMLSQGDYFEKLGDINQAVRYWEMILKFEPENMDAKMRLMSIQVKNSVDAELNRFKGDYKKAVEYYRNKLEENPHDEHAVKMLRFAEIRMLGIDF